MWWRGGSHHGFSYSGEPESTAAHARPPEDGERDDDFRYGCNAGLNVIVRDTTYAEAIKEEDELVFSRMPTKVNACCESEVRLTPDHDGWLIFRMATRYQNATQ
jgi:hypothetical protein